MIFYNILQNILAITFSNAIVWISNPSRACHLTEVFHDSAANIYLENGVIMTS